MQEKHKFNAPLEVPDAFELRHIEDDSDSDFSDDFAQGSADLRDKFYKPDMDLKGLDPDQAIGGFDKLVLVEKRNWREIIAKNGQDGYAFIDNIPSLEDVVVPKAGEGHSDEVNRLLYVIVQCIPIPLMRRFTKSDSIIVPILLKKQQTLKQVYKSVNTYLRDAIEERGLHSMRNSTKLILSE